MGTSDPQPVETGTAVYYVRDAQGTILAVYEKALTGSTTSTAAPTLVEQPIYGSARLGERLTRGLSLAVPTNEVYTREVGLKRYELSDHLGNVRAVVSDEALARTDGPVGLKPDLLACFNYYPFGMEHPGRVAPGNSTLAGGYRFGFNGKEKDNNGELGLTNYDYGFRIYNPAYGRFLSEDPLTKKYPELTPYQFAGNTPIWAIDLDGLEPVVSSQYITNTIWDSWSQTSGHPLPADINTNEQAAKKYGWELSKEGINAYVNVMGFATGPEDLIFIGLGKLALAYKASRFGKVLAKIVHAEEVALKVERTVAAEIKAEVKAGKGIVKGEKSATRATQRIICGCFTAPTLIHTSRGSKAIEQVQVGDSVWAFNELTRQDVLRPVTKLFRYERDTLYILHTSAEETINTTSDHPFYMGGGWVRARHLRAGDSLISQNGQRYLVRQIETKVRHVTVYNFTVDELHTYYVGKSAILVHNNPCAKEARLSEFKEWRQAEPDMQSEKSIKYFEERIKAGDTSVFTKNGQYIYTTKIDGNMYILDGHHRVEAARRAGFEGALPYKEVSNAEISKYSNFKDAQDVLDASGH